METLLAIGIVAAFVYSVVETIRGGTHLSFHRDRDRDVVLAGKLIERGAKDDAMRSISRLHRMMPAKAPAPACTSDLFPSIAWRRRFILVKAGRIPDGVVLRVRATPTNRC
jgi:cation transport ATPase